MPNRKPNAKKAPATKNWANEILAIIDDWFKPLVDLMQNWEKLRDIVANNYQLGLHHLQLGNIGDAVFRFRLVTWLDPKHADGWYYLGCSYMAEGKKPLALRALRKALLLKPDYEEAAYMLAIARGPATPLAELPKRIPLVLAQSHFDSIAADYTEDQLNNLQYQGHALLALALHNAVASGRVDHMILELGVGTGLCGPYVRDLAAQIIGIDMSGPMLDEAMRLRDEEGRKIYDALIKREMLAFLSQSPAETYDIVLSAGAFSFVGDLQPLFLQIERVLKLGGIFAFTADAMPESVDGDSFRFIPAAGRFRYRKSYLHGLATTCGLNEASCEEGEAYPGYPTWICVFCK